MYTYTSDSMELDDILRSIITIPSDNEDKIISEIKAKIC